MFWTPWTKIPGYVGYALDCVTTGKFVLGSNCTLCLGLILYYQLTNTKLLTYDEPSSDVVTGILARGAQAH